MVASQLDVGRLIHTNSTLGTRLTSTCHLSLSSDRNSKHSTPAVDEQWVSRGNGLTLLIVLNRTSVCPDDSRWQEACEALGRSLEQAEIWSQLALRAEFQALPSDQTGLAMITLALKYDELKGKTTQASSQTLPVIIQRVEPPTCVVSTYLHQVRLVLEFTSSQQRLKRARTKDSGTQEGDDMLFESTTYKQPCGSTQDMLEDQQSPKSEECLDRKSSTHSDDMLDDRWTMDEAISTAPWNEECEDLLDYEDIPSQETLDSSQIGYWNSQGDSSQHSNTTTTSLAPTTSKRPLECTEASEPPPQLGDAELVQFVDAALRTFICWSRTRQPRGISLTTNKVQKGLAEIAPTLFSPGFACAVSQRARYIPMIAASLKGISGRAQTSSLLRVFRRFQADNLSNESPASGRTINRVEQEPTQVDLYRILERRLWMLSRKNLFDPRAARRLKQIGQGGAVGTHAPYEEEYLFDQELDEHRREGHFHEVQTAMLDAEEPVELTAEHLSSEERMAEDFDGFEMIFSEDDEDLLHHEEEEDFTDPWASLEQELMLTD